MGRDITIAQRLRSAGLRPTIQRIALADLLFGGCHRHVTAEELHAEATDSGIVLSLATVYNTLHQFTNAGLIRALAVDGTRTWFDTNIEDHHHFFVEGEGTILDVEAHQLQVLNLPTPPDGMVVAHVDVVIRLKPILKIGSS
jgi:Fur family transcriptional regulator, iron response regulator